MAEREVCNCDYCVYSKTLEAPPGVLSWLGPAKEADGAALFNVAPVRESTIEEIIEGLAKAKRAVEAAVAPAPKPAPCEVCSDTGVMPCPARLPSCEEHDCRCAVGLAKKRAHVDERALNEALARGARSVLGVSSPGVRFWTERPIRAGDLLELRPDGTTAGWVVTSIADNGTVTLNSVEPNVVVPVDALQGIDVQQSVPPDERAFFFGTLTPDPAEAPLSVCAGCGVAEDEQRDGETLCEECWAFGATLKAGEVLAERQAKRRRQAVLDRDAPPVAPGPVEPSMLETVRRRVAARGKGWSGHYGLTGPPPAPSRCRWPFVAALVAVALLAAGITWGPGIVARFRAPATPMSVESVGLTDWPTPYSHEGAH